jgi:hypothetical protein
MTLTVTKSTIIHVMEFIHCDPMFYRTLAFNPIFVHDNYDRAGSRSLFCCQPLALSSSLNPDVPPVSLSALPLFRLSTFPPFRLSSSPPHYLSTQHILLAKTISQLAPYLVASKKLQIIQFLINLCLTAIHTSPAPYVLPGMCLRTTPRLGATSFALEDFLGDMPALPELDPCKLTHVGVKLCGDNRFKFHLIYRRPI